MPPRRRILLVEDVHRQLVAAATASEPIETGGILMGVTADRVPWITAMAEIPSASPSPSRYVLPKGETWPELEEARSRDPRVGYLGEWHSHSVDAGPSLIDRQMMRTLAWFLPRPTPGPVLLIVRRSVRGFAVDPYVTTILALRRAQLIDTGALPQPIVPPASP
jgi:proteasome lid subunit RPN8/RPN11